MDWYILIQECSRFIRGHFVDPSKQISLRCSLGVSFSTLSVEEEDILFWHCDEGVFLAYFAQLVDPAFPLNNHFITVPFFLDHFLHILGITESKNDANISRIYIGDGLEYREQVLLLTCVWPCVCLQCNEYHVNRLSINLCFFSEASYPIMETHVWVVCAGCIYYFDIISIFLECVRWDFLCATFGHITCFELICACNPVHKSALSYTKRAEHDDVLFFLHL